MSFIEVCSGCGGLSSGLMKAGLVPLLLNEIDSKCCDTLRKNHDPDIVYQGDMNDLVNDDTLKQYKGNLDLLAGGVPCQAFSQAGMRKGLEDKRGGLILVFRKLLRKLMPKMFLIENVKGLLTHNGGDTFKYIVKKMSLRDKYRISYKLLNSADYLVPQKRERIIIIGVRSDINSEFVFPRQHERRVVLRDVLTEDIENAPGMVYPEKKRAVMDLVPPGGCWVNLPLDIQKEYMGKSMDSGGGKRGIARRLSMNEPSLTLTTSPCQKQTERCHPTITRPLNIKEYARIQTFPDSYEFVGSLSQQYKMIGNAVPVKMAYYVGKAIKEFLNSI
jgi:DNA (cytosine-5)-methyltransferase 1